MHRNWENDMLNVIAKAIEAVKTPLLPLFMEKLRMQSARKESLEAINNIASSVNNEPMFNPFEQNSVNDSSNSLNNEGQSNTKDKVRVRNIQNPFMPNGISRENEPEKTVSSVTSGPSAFNTAPQDNNMYSFIERGGFSGTFILIAGIILMVITFLVSFMVFTYLGV